MGIMGELFPGQKLNDESGQDGDGQTHKPRVELDLDAGVIRLAPAPRPEQAEPPAAD
ncbi:hypothetical protein ACWDOP_07755 [Nocardia sp. NPDC003693]